MIEKKLSWLTQNASLTFIRRFIQLEASSGILLLVMAFLALWIANSPWRVDYHHYLTVTLGAGNFNQSILWWINDACMAVFFLLVGLEIKREMLEGELNSWAKAALPAIAALGGMLVPALFYIACNWGDSVALQGWAIPTATDIAFSLTILALLGARIPTALKIFLMALAIFDDVGGIIIIAVFYTQQIAWLFLGFAAILWLVLWIFNRCQVQRAAPYLIVGILLWICILKSGIHPTLSGIILATTIPLHHRSTTERSLLRHLEQKLHPWVAFGILPLFAFANAGVFFGGMSWQHLMAPVTIGIVGGLFLGKQLGIFTATWLSVRCRIAQLAPGISFAGIYGVALVAGVGFTMSLFMGGLAFGYGEQLNAILLRAGVLGGSLLSGIVGYCVLRYIYRYSSSH